MLFLLSSVSAGLWCAFAGFAIVMALKRPDAVSNAIGYALYPLLLFIISVWCFRKLNPKAE
jgi:hypothetical protein